jgi:hypothetical protein
MGGLFIAMSAAAIGDFTGRAAVALALGALVGAERQWRQRMAGLRTNALVTLDVALFELPEPAWCKWKPSCSVSGATTSGWRQRPAASASNPLSAR